MTFSSISKRIRQLFKKQICHKSLLVMETETDGFIYGELTDHFDFDEEGGCTFGDGFVQAPNGSRAGVIGDVSEKPYLLTCIEPDENRWGVYNIGFVKPIKTVEDLVYNFQAALPLIKEAYNRAEQGK